MTLAKLMIVATSTLLVSCSATRPAPPAPTSSASLSSFVLIIQERPDGQLTHAWRPVESMDLSRYRRLRHGDGQTGKVLPAAARQRDCDQENQDCYRNCMRRPLAPEYESYESPRKRGGKSEFCRRECQQAYDDCLELERLRPQEFTAADGAVDWLKRHILAPVVLVASADVLPAGFVLAEER